MLFRGIRELLRHPEALKLEIATSQFRWLLENIPAIDRVIGIGWIYSFYIESLFYRWLNNQNLEVVLE